MNNKDTPEKCEATLCCKATAELQVQIEREKTAEDKSLAELLNNQDTKICEKTEDANKNTQE